MTSPEALRSSSTDPSPDVAGIVLFDGVCGFCDRSVRFLLARDTRARLRFAALQGESAAEMRARHPDIPEEIETLVFVESSPEGRVYLRSSALFRVARELDPPWNRAAALGALPRWLTDAVYALVVRFRYRIFGRLEACAIPAPEVRERFLP